MTALKPPKLTNDCFALPPGVDWVPVDEALDRLRAALRVVAPSEMADLGGAAGRILAEDQVAQRSHPPTANSAVDGYGFAHGAQLDGDTELPLQSGRSAAGAPYDGTVPFGRALRILTGAPLPEGVDTVVLEEDVTSDGDRIAFHGPLKAGANTRMAGEDSRAGQTVLPRGRKLTAADLALLASVGIACVSVYRPLRVGVLSTGDELTDPAPDQNPARTFDANRPMLQALLRHWGFETVDLGICPDNRDTLRARLDDGAARTDAILTSGGASAGDEDHVSAILRAEGTVSTWRIALKPGRPLALGLWQGVPIFGLPGNPVASLVCTLIFARPALALMGGQGWRSPMAVTVPAAFTKTKKPGRREFLRARLTPDGTAEVFASEGSGRISGLSWAEGLVELPDGPMTITPGIPVRYLPFSGFD
jgi:molybdopterin molybdotransferase